MEYLFIIVLAAAVFGLCWLIDKGFTKIFRSQAQHFSGLSVRLKKSYATQGVIFTVFGVLALFAGIKNGLVLLIGGIFVLVFGLGMILYYLSTGIFYDKDAFLFTSFGKKSRSYPYRDICCQQLYTVTGGNLLVELHLKDGRAIQLHSNMTGTEEFLNYAFDRWCAQTGRRPEDCDFHDPSNSLWFPAKEDA